MYSKNIRMS